jgi:alpha-beta hydrolase superfamily lysophospholipase
MKLETSYGTTNVYRNKPEQPSAKVLVVAGYSESAYHFAALLDALSDRGMDAITFNDPRRGLNKTGEVLDPIERQARILLDVLSILMPKGEKVHALAHSLGAAAVLKAAQLEPDRFESLILMQPAGITEDKVPVFKLARGVAKKVFNNHSKFGLADLSSHARVAKSHLASTAVIASNPVLAWQEAVSAANYRIVEDLEAVAKLGIPVHLTVSKGDELYDHVLVNSGRQAMEGLTHSYTVLEESIATHDTFWLHPENTAEQVKNLILTT